VLSEDRVVGIALGLACTLAVTDAGAVFSFGDGEGGVLGHGSLEAEVLPRRIEALTQTGCRFVTVAAGGRHALALAEEGELYGWGNGCTNGHGRNEPIPHLMAAFVGQRVRLVCASAISSCAVTEKGELYTWGQGESGQLGHGDEEDQLTPKRVEGLIGVKVAAAATCYTLTHSWPTRTAWCGHSASARLSASATRARAQMKTSRKTYWSRNRSPLCVCAPTGSQTCCRSGDEAFRAAWDAVGHGCARWPRSVLRDWSPSSWHA